MKTILIVTSGSRGDVQPYVALAIELKARGARVVVATEKRMEDFVKSFAGLEYAEIAGDPFGLLHEPGSQELLAEGKIMKVMMEAEKFNKPFAEDVLRTIATACQGADAIVTAPLTQTATMCVAEQLGVPWVPAYLGPVWPTSEFCSWAFSTKPWRWKWANKFSYRLLVGALWAQEKGRINKWRVSALGLKPLRSGPLSVMEAAGGSIPVLLMCTPHMTPGLRRPPDYPNFVQYTGFAYVPESREADIDPQLKEFITAGEAPIYLGFGSMPAPDPRKLLQLAVEVVERTGRRAVMVAGWSGVPAVVGDGEGQVQLPPELLLVSAAPHDWLLPRCCVCVHHAGVGTCAAALRAGIPSVPCPVMLDQPANAMRLLEAGCAQPPVPFQRLTAEVLSERIAAACSDEAMSARAKEVALSIMRDWRGVAQAADAVLAARSPWDDLRAAGAI